MQWNSKEKALMIEMARKEFSFFEYFVNEKTSYLPPDNIQTEPLEKIALRTSPTNIGLYLAVLICGHDLGFIKTEELITRLEKSLEKIETLERWNGHLYNWYDLNTLCKIGDDFVSTVDSGNYFACIVVVVQALKKIIGKDPRIPNLIAILEKEIEAADFSKLLNVEKNVLSVGIYPESQSENGQNYDLYMSEARITAFLGIGLGKLKDSVWKSFNLPLLTYQGRMGIGSWSGTAFEFFMAPLFIPVIENSLEDESLDFALFCQKKYSSFINFKEKIFGISESGYSLTDFHGNYQYKAFGVPYLSIQDGKDFPKVISPYSSFLMLNRKDRDLLKNLQRMEKNGLFLRYT